MKPTPLGARRAAKLALPPGLKFTVKETSRSVLLSDVMAMLCSTPHSRPASLLCNSAGPSSDPDERSNLVNDPAYAEAAAAFAAEVAERWDSKGLRADVLRTQKSRRALHAAMEAGASEPWDYNPPRDASQEYVRNNMDWTVAAARYRFPPTGEET